MAGNLKAFTDGITKNTPPFLLMLGVCPTLASTTSVKNAVAMGFAAGAVLVCSNVIISALRKAIPKAVRIPCFIVVIASFVTIVDMVMKGFFYEQSRALSIFIPLIVVNCIILGRAEAFAAKNTVLKSFLDGAGVGTGYMMSLILVSTIREVSGNGTLLGYPIYLDSAGRTVYQPLTVLVLPAGAFLLFGIIMAAFRYVGQRRRQRAVAEGTFE